MNCDLEAKIARMAYADTFYQVMLKECEELGKEYERIREILSENDKEILDRYIALCEELEHQRGRMAYAVGTQDGMRSGTALLNVE